MTKAGAKMAFFEARNITVAYKRNGDDIHPVENISFSLESGRIYDITGPSGSGKSTLITACARMLEREKGSLSLAGYDSESYTPEQWRRRVCLVPQQAVMFLGTVKENLLYAWRLAVNSKASEPDDRALKALLEAVLLDDVNLNTNASQLSGGQQARVSLLRSFITRPAVLLLDEVEAALDDESAMAVSRLTRAFMDEETTCLRIRHRADDGYTFGTFVLENGTIEFFQNDLTEHNRPVSEAQNEACDADALIKSLPHIALSPDE